MRFYYKYASATQLSCHTVELMYRCRFALSPGLVSAFTVLVSTAPAGMDPEVLTGWAKIIDAIVGGLATLFGIFSMFGDREDRRESYKAAQ
jgi:hypothetical protein